MPGLNTRDTVRIEGNVRVLESVLKCWKSLAGTLKLSKQQIAELLADFSNAIASIREITLRFAPEADAVYKASVSHVTNNNLVDGMVLPPRAELDKVQNLLRVHESIEKLHKTGEMDRVLSETIHSNAKSKPNSKRKAQTAKHNSDVLPKDPEEGLAPPRNGNTYDNAEVVGILKDMDKARRIVLCRLWTTFDETGKYIGKGRYHCLYTNRNSLLNAIKRAKQNKRIRPTGKPGRPKKHTGFGRI